jgi:hypothetical protein
MQPHQQRVIDEKKALDENIEKLSAFLTDDSKRVLVDDAEQDRMQRQLDCMIAYSGILGERIDAFGLPIEQSETSTEGDDTDIDSDGEGSDEE